MTTTLSALSTTLDQMASLTPSELQAALDAYALTPGQEQVLRELLSRFVGSVTSPESSPPSQLLSVSNNPWKVFRRIEALNIPDHFQSILNLGSASFVNSYDDAVIHDNLMPATRRAQQQSVQRLRELFTALALYDIARSRFARFSGNRLSDRMKDELNSLLRGCDASQQYKVGKNLDHICKIFGPGCVFYLDSCLSNDFLCKKFTSSGQYHDGAVEHLSALGLKQLAEESRANEFARHARCLSVSYLELRTSQM
ncbi:hypothetical protein D6D05_00363 [Aureobasidium pullulans]|nr:hypothetical protein D6D05_00363 [Aureobasidium pullulans]